MSLILPICSVKPSMDQRIPAPLIAIANNYWYRNNIVKAYFPLENLLMSNHYSFSLVLLISFEVRTSIYSICLI